MGYQKLGRHLKQAVRNPRRFASNLGRAVLSETIRLGNDPERTDLNEWQRAFCEWQAERLGTDTEEMVDRFLESENAIYHGHGGGEFRKFAHLSYSLYLPFVSDSEQEVFESYAFHQHMHFLRFLSYPLPDWPADHPVIAAHRDRRDVRITDFGCGLAQNSISLVRALRAAGGDGALQLADVSGLQLAFLEWLCARDGWPCRIHRCTRSAPFPDFEPADVLFAEEVVEHVHDTVATIDALDRLIAPGGFLIGNLEDHQEEFMHVSPDLRLARDRLAALGYAEVADRHVYRKAA